MELLSDLRTLFKNIELFANVEQRATDKNDAVALEKTIFDAIELASTKSSDLSRGTCYETSDF